LAPVGADEFAGHVEEVGLWSEAREVLNQAPRPSDGARFEQHRVVGAEDVYAVARRSHPHQVGLQWGVVGDRCAAEMSGPAQQRSEVAEATAPVRMAAPASGVVLIGTG